jgi:hypothetical protein
MYTYIKHVTVWYWLQKRQVTYGGHAQLARRHKGQDLSKVPGQAGVDYPIFHSVPDTNFHCGNVPAVPGLYANIETGCQVCIHTLHFSSMPASSFSQRY